MEYGITNSMKTTIIYGPAGTGKTTKLLSILEQHLADGVKPEHIGFFTFTRKAANEAVTRAREKFGFSQSRMPYFRTLHSFAFFEMGMAKASVMQNSDYKVVCDKVGAPVSSQPVSMTAEQFLWVQPEKGDKLIFAENLARIRRATLEETFSHLHPEEYTLQELKLFRATLEKHKQEHHVYDFTDMLERYNSGGNLPVLEIVIIDEAQDLSVLQWALVSRITEKEVKQLYVAGDDDQSIFNWAGAEASALIHMEGQRIVLDKSYRIPRKVHRLAMSIVGHIRERVEKVFEPRPEEGEIHYHTALELVNMSKGEWLVLARNTYQLAQVAEHCLQAGYWCDAPGMAEYGRVVKLIRGWESLRRGKTCTVSTANALAPLLGIGDSATFKMTQREERFALAHFVRKGAGSTIWHEAMVNIPLEVREYLISALRRKEDLLAPPRIKISTIHGAKGGEADNVLLLTDISKRTEEEMEKNPDAEHRVWYVAVTRARKTLHIVEPRTNRSYYEHLFKLSS